MQILRTNTYVGPNLYAHFPVIRYILDLGELEHWPSARLGEGFIQALLDCLPGLDEHGCSYREPGGFVRRLREDEGTWLGHVMEHVVLELQNIAGSDVTFGRTRSIEGNAGPDSWPWICCTACCLRSSGRPTRRHKTGISTPSATSSFSTPSAAPSDPAPPRWCGPRRSATFPGFD